jgi:hypothetical protein
VIFVADFINNLTEVFEDMARTNKSLQHKLNELMTIRSTDAYVTRIWSTCSSMLTIDGIKGKDEDEPIYTIDDSTKHLPPPSVLQCIQQSSNRMLKVTTAGQRGVKASFEDLYAHFLIEGHTHTTHYVSMSQEFPDHEDDSTNIAGVASRCKKSVAKTKTIVLVALDSAEKKLEVSNQTITPVASEGFSAKKIVSELLERLLIDGINTVVVLTNPAENTDLSNLFDEVNQRIKEVSKA